MLSEAFLKSLIDGCSHFTWAEALYLPSWKCYHIPTDEEKKNIIQIALKAEKARSFLGVPFNVHCWIRPKQLNNINSSYHGQDYNKFVGGAAGSPHPKGNAIDFNPVGMDCETARQLLIPKLEPFGLRMEDNGKSATWVHLDDNPPNPHSFFKP